MRDAVVIVFLPDPFGLGRAEFFILEGQAAARRVDPGELAEVGQSVVTLDAARLIAELRSLGFPPPVGLVDIGEALRLLRGKAKNDGGVKAADPWRALKRVARRSGNAAAVESFKKMFHSEVEWKNEHERNALAELVVVELRNTWLKVVDLLDVSEELGRFEEVERRVGRIFYERQSFGIALDLDRISALIAAADHEKYTAYNLLADSLGVSPSGLTFRNVGPLLERTDAAHLLPYAAAPNFEEYVRLAAAHSSFAAQLVTLVRAGRDIRGLARLRGEGTGVARPEFQIMGTVTGRILVSNPSLQQIRRNYRDIIVAGPDKKLAYLDFAQFEPGILASLSEDGAFLDRYNAGDIYTELSLALFHDAGRRAIAKRMFLSFSYGMSPERIVQILGGEEPGETLGAFREFVSAFPGLIQFRLTMEDALHRDGYVGTLFGNRRYRTGEGDLRHDERRWAVSQAVQGTASLIFKEALVNMSEILGSQAVLLPMHDAVLLQLPLDSYEADVVKAEAAMLGALNARCPDVAGRIVTTDHF